MCFPTIDSIFVYAYAMYCFRVWKVLSRSSKMFADHASTAKNVKKHDTSKEALKIYANRLHDEKVANSLHVVPMKK